MPPKPASKSPPSSKAPKPAGSAAPKPKQEVHKSTAKVPKAAAKKTTVKPPTKAPEKKEDVKGEQLQVPGTEEKVDKPKPEPAPEASAKVRKIGGMSVQKVSEREDFVKLLVYGLPGSGKTYLIGTAQDIESMSPVLVIDIEGGTKTLRKQHPDIDVIRIKDVWDVKGRLVSSAWKQLQDVYDDLKTGKSQYKTVALDTLTEAHSLSLSLAIEFNVEKAEAKGRDRDPEAPEQADWGRAGTMVRKMVRAFRDLDCHVIFTAHEAELKDEKTGGITVQPSLPGKLAKEVPGYMDEVLYLYAKEEVIDKDTKKRGVVRKILTQPTGKYVAKDRSDNMPLVLSDPTMEKIAGFVLGDGKVQEEEELQEGAA